MTLLVGLLVLFAAARGAGMHAIIAKAQDRQVMRALISIIAGGCYLPLVFFVSPPGPTTWLFLALSVPVHVSYNMVLIRAYDYGDFSAVFPLARGIAPLMVAVVSAVVLGEYLTSAQLGGVLGICAGVILLTGYGARRSPLQMDKRAVALATLAALHISCYTILDGLGVRSAERAVEYITYFFVCEGSAMAVILLLTRRGRLLSAWRDHKQGGICGGLGTALAFGIALWALGQMPIALVSALRETSSLFAALIGVVIFREAFGPRRILAATIVCLGVIIINLPLDLRPG